MTNAIGQNSGKLAQSPQVLPTNGETENCLLNGMLETISSAEAGGPFTKQATMKMDSCISSGDVHNQEDDDLVSHWTEESCFDASIVSACAIEVEDEGAQHIYETRLNDESHTEEDAESYEESIKSISESRDRPNTRRRNVNRSLLARTTRGKDIGGDMDDAMHAYHTSGLTTEGQEAHEEREERTVEEFIGSSGDCVVLDVAESGTDLKDSEIAEDDDIHDDDAQSTDAFSLKLPSFSVSGRGNFDSMSTISFALDDLGYRSRSEVTDFEPIVFVMDGDEGCASVVTRESASTAQTRSSASMMSEMQSIKSRALSRCTHGTAASSIMSCTPTAIATNVAMAASVANTKDMEKSNAIISNLTRNIKSKRKKGEKNLELSGGFLQRLQGGDERSSISRSRSWGSTKQRRRPQQRRGKKKSAPPRRKSSDDVEIDVSFDKRTDQTCSITGTFQDLNIDGPMPRVARTNSSSKIDPTIHSGRLQTVEQAEGSDRSIVLQSASRTLQQAEPLGVSDRSIVSQGWLSQSSSGSPRLGHLHELQLQGKSDRSIISQGISRSRSADRVSKNSSFGGLSRSRSAGRLSRSGSASRLSRSGSAGRLPRSNSGNRLDRIANFAGVTAPRRMLSRSGSGSGSGNRLPRDDSTRTGSESAEGRRMVKRLERVHVVPKAMGPSNRRMLARVNSAKKVVLDDQRMTGSHSRRNIFKIEETKDLRH